MIADVDYAWVRFLPDQFGSTQDVLLSIIKQAGNSNNIFLEELMAKIWPFKFLLDLATLH